MVFHRHAWTCWGFALSQSGLGRKELFTDQLLPSGWNRMLTSLLSLGSLLSAAEWVDDGVACKDEDVSSDGRRRLNEGERLTANFNDSRRTRNRLRSSPLRQRFLLAERTSILRVRWEWECFQKCPAVSSTAHSDSGPDSLSLTSETSEERFDILDLPDSESRRRCLHSIDFYPKNYGNAALKTSHKVGPSR